jgi:putative transposase
MPRRDRCILPGVACHVTQRGVDRRETFSAAADRETYLSLMRQNLEDAGVGLLAWCLMTNHIHVATGKGWGMRPLYREMRPLYR